jgi:hypothetical protein
LGRTKTDTHMIIIDMNQISISHLMVRKEIDGEININSVRKSILKMLAELRRKYSPEHSEIILAYDDKVYWRSEVFPYYKKNRKKEREEASLDWDQVFSVLNTIKEELYNNFSCFKVIQALGAEADDVIATLCFHNARKEIPEPVIILSADKDFLQLHRFPFVKQYDTIHKKWLECENPITYLREHIIMGDRSDGIPNILSADDTIVTGKRQKTMSKEKISELASMSPEKFNNQTKIRNWKRNVELIDFTKIPQEIRERILMKFYNYKPHRPISIDYFMANNITELMESFS